MSLFTQKIKNKSNRFEGWYVRFVDLKNSTNEAFILAYTTNQEDPHAFTQYFNGVAKTNEYTRYDSKAYRFEAPTVHLGPNRLTEKSLFFENEGMSLNLSFEHPRKPNKSAMSFLRFLPLECFQEVIVMEAKAKGTRQVEGQTMDVEGTIYIEKTYGRRFPKQWFWLQSHHFDQEGVRLSFAGGSVPTLKFRPIGFFCLVEKGEEVYRFATYKRSRFNAIDLGDKVVFTVRQGTLNLRLEVTDHDPTALVGPNDFGLMNLEVFESLTANVTLTLTDESKTLIHAKSSLAGFEWMGQN